MGIYLDRYKSTDSIRHPSWRIYKALDDVRLSAPDFDSVVEASPELFGLKTDIDVYYPYTTNDELTEEIILAISDKDYTDGKYFCIADCMNLFCDIHTRQLVEGMLMMGSIAADIAADTGYKPAVIETYASAFYDTSVWRTPADRLAYLTKGVCGEDGRIKNLIINKGLEWVQVREFRMPAKLKMDKALSTLFGKAYGQAMTYLDSDDGEDQHTAQEWVKRSVEIFRELKSATKSEGGIRELTIALETNPAPKVGLKDLD